MNGQEVSSVPYTSSINAIVGATPAIGSYANNYTGTNFTGSLDDVRVYSRALSAAEIAAIYAATQ